MDSRSTNDVSPDTSASPSRPELSDREREILILVATGASNKLIAQQLVISPNTVKVHLRNVFAKLGVASRTEAALYAIREGLVQVNGELPAIAADDEPPAAAERAPAPAADIPPVSAPVAAPPRPRWGVWLALGVFVVVVVALGWWAYGGRPAAPTAVAPTSIPPTAIPRWRTLPDLPTARAGLAVTTYENQVYAIGGETAAGITGSVERFDPATDTWDTLTAKPIAVADAGAVVIGGQIYVPGGRLATGASSDALEVYHPAEDRWETRAALPGPISGYALVAFEGQLYLFGGWDGEQYLAAAYVYDPGRDTWRSLPAMPTSRAFAGAAVAGGQIYVVGGEAAGGPLAVNEVFLPARANQASGAWETRQALPEARTGVGLTSLADIVYAVGGAGTAETLSAWSYLPTQDTWRPLDAPDAPSTTRLGLTALQARLFVVGGEQAGEPNSQTLTYQAIYTTIFPGVSGE